MLVSVSESREAKPTAQTTSVNTRCHCIKWIDRDGAVLTASNIYISLTWQENFKVSQCVVRMGVVAWVLLLCLCLKTTTMKLMIRRSFLKKKNILMIVLISCFETPPLSQCKGRKWTPSAIFLFICWSVLFCQHYWNSVPLERSERDNYLRQIFRYLDKPFGYRS